MNIGKKIYDLRKSKGFSQEDIATKLNVSRQTVSKWETNTSIPDIDKIVSLCDLFDITTDELLRGVKTDSNKDKGENNKSKYTPLVVSISVLLYIISIIWIIIGEETLYINEGVLVGIFLFIIGVPTSILVYHFMSLPKEEKKHDIKFTPEIKKKIDVIEAMLAILVLIIYLSLSFVTGDWYITWILWVIYAFVCKIVELIFEYKEDINGK